MDSKLLQGGLYRNCNEPYEKLSEILVDILNHHAPLKEKQIMGNHAHFMNKELSKAIMENSKTRNDVFEVAIYRKLRTYKKSKNKM